MSDQPIPVVFRICDGGLVAVLPTLAVDDNPWLLTCYGADGERCDCEYDRYKRMKPAKIPQYRALLRKLEAPPFCFRLEAAARVTTEHHIVRIASLRAAYVNGGGKLTWP